MTKFLTHRSFLYDSLVTVLVGPEKHRFDVHRALVCASSDFFQAALNGGFKEQGGEINLPDQETKTFKFFVHWLYTGKLRGFYYPKTLKPSLEKLRNAALDELKDQDLNNIQSLRPDNTKGRAFNLANYRDAPFLDLVALYILADTLYVHNLKDPIATLIIEVYGIEEHDRDDQSEGEDEEEEINQDEAESDNASNANDEKKGNEKVDDDDVEHMEEDTLLFWGLDRPIGIEDPVKGINMAWDSLPANSPLCKLLVRCFCDGVVNVAARTQTQEYHTGFLAAIAHEYALRWAKGHSAIEGTDWDKEGEICKFHEHGQEDECAFASRNATRRVLVGDI